MQRVHDQGWRKDVPRVHRVHRVHGQSSKDIQRVHNQGSEKKDNASVIKELYSYHQSCNPLILILKWLYNSIDDNRASVFVA